MIKSSKKTEITLDSSILDHAWSCWLSENVIKQSNRVTYSFVLRGARLPQQFEAWLSNNGGRVKEIAQDHRVIVFNDPKDATIFILKYA